MIYLPGKAFTIIIAVGKNAGLWSEHSLFGSCRRWTAKYFFIADSISSTPQLKALQEACLLFEKEREQWKQERLGFLKRIEALEAENKQLRDRLALNSQNSSKPPSTDVSRKSKSSGKNRGNPSSSCSLRLCIPRIKSGTGFTAPLLLKLSI